MGYIITIGREFGSGGRELGRRLADELGIAYYDREILLEIQKRTPYCLAYIERVSEEKSFSLPHIHYGMSFDNGYDTVLKQDNDVHIAQNEFLKEIASKSDCVIIGRAADYVLRDLHPIRIFVYADMETKLKRCRERQKKEEASLSDKEFIKRIQKVEKNRSRFYEFYTGQEWGCRRNYDFMVNTSHLDIKMLAKNLATLIKESNL